MDFVNYLHIIMHFPRFEYNCMGIGGKEGWMSLIAGDSLKGLYNETSTLSIHAREFG